MEKSFEPGSVLKKSDYNGNVKGLPVWQLALLVWCICAVAFFVLKLANVI